MAHTSTRAFADTVRAFASSLSGGVAPRAYADNVRRPYYVDTGKILSGAITENTLPASNTRVALINARTMVPTDVQRILGGSYLFRSVPDADLGYYVMGIDLDGTYRPVCEGPVFPVAP